MKKLTELLNRTIVDAKLGENLPSAFESSGGRVDHPTYNDSCDLLVLEFDDGATLHLVGAASVEDDGMIMRGRLDLKFDDVKLVEEECKECGDVTWCEEGEMPLCEACVAALAKG